MQDPYDKIDSRPGFAWRAFHFLPIAGKQDNALNAVTIGMLGASKVGSYAIIWPSKRCRDAKVTAVAARSQQAADNYARKHKIANSYQGYDGVIQDKNVEVVYVGLPNGLHGQWSIQALQAGKHVLCEKPFAANEEEAKQVQKVAKKHNRLCVEAFHYLHHPLFKNIQKRVQNEEIGQIQEIRATFKRPFWCKFFSPKDIRYDFSLAGGATMDLGCYCIHAIRHLTQCSRPEVIHAVPKISRNATGKQMYIDESMKCELWCSSKYNRTQPIKAYIDVSLSEGWWFQNELQILGSRGKIQCRNFLFPFWGHTLRIEDENNNCQNLCYYGSGLSTYDYQLIQFVKEVRNRGKHIQGERWISNANDSVDNMFVIDRIYEAGRMPLRIPTTKF
eukprot:TRINITY_DN16455_c0_g1_i11.p1 TRINITY_DN16455_c0_g1~~TRINITY_DN16455_c0_g1_i11.p1  ORF type:complete len:408 (+),score=15.42 TRINITY_DN16455_c0_g1_i11:59-1225(+)